MKAIYTSVILIRYKVLLFAAIVAIQGVLPIFAALAAANLVNKIVGLTPSADNYIHIILAISLLGCLNATDAFLNHLNEVNVNVIGRIYERSAIQRIQSYILQEIATRKLEDPIFQEELSKARETGSRSLSEAFESSSNLLKSIITIISFAGFLSTINGISAFILFIVIIPMIYFDNHIISRRYNLFKTTILDRRLAGYLDTLLTSPYYAKELRIFDFGNSILAKYNWYVQKYDKSAYELDKTNLKYNLISSIITILIFIIAVFTLIITKNTTISPGDIVLYLSSVAALQGTLRSVSVQLANLKQSEIQFKDYSAIFNYKSTSKAEISALPPKYTPLEFREIKFLDVGFQYPGQSEYAIKNVNFHLNRGQTVAIIGENGSGKSTLVKILMQFYEDYIGEIYVNDINIKDIDIKRYRTYISAVFQDFSRYEDTLVKNLDLSGDDITLNKEKIDQALTFTGLNSVVANLENGIDTYLGRWLHPEEKSVDLSGGEWQKIAIARSLYKIAPIVIYDEPTASIDARSSNIIIDNLFKFNSHSLKIIITHNLGIARKADVIIVMEKGKIDDMGNHTYLMENSKKYKTLYESQARNYQ